MLEHESGIYVFFILTLEKRYAPIPPSLQVWVVGNDKVLELQVLGATDRDCKGPVKQPLARVLNKTRYGIKPMGEMQKISLCN
jgi:hypothetical protein